MIYRKTILILILLLIFKVSFSHDASLSYTTITIDSNKIELKITIPMDVLSTLFPKNNWYEKTDVTPFIDYFNKKYIITNENVRVKTKFISDRILRDIREYSFDFELTSDETFDHLLFNYDMFFEVSETHENITQFIFGQQSSELILSKTNNKVSINVNELRKQWGLLPYLKKNSVKNNAPAPKKTDTISKTLDEKDTSSMTSKITPIEPLNDKFPDTSKTKNSTAKSENQQLFTGNESWNRFKDFFIVGVEHILTGYDHIMFLLGLLLMITGIGNLLKVITSFTIAHSITLAIAVLGIYALPSMLTETMIALSISFVAFENIYIQKLQSNQGEKPSKFLSSIIGNPKKRWRLTFFFGLIHGFGFSAALRELGMPEGTRALSLFSFNLGVEAGQLLLVASVFPIIWYLRKKNNYTIVVRVVSISIGIAGLGLAVQRLFFS